MEILEVLSRGGFGRIEKVLVEDGAVVARKVFDPAPGLTDTEARLYQVRVSDIERRTGLDFGPLTAVDTLGPEAAADRGPRPIHEFEDIHLRSAPDLWTAHTKRVARTRRTVREERAR
jgi:hypothetical protein